MDLEYLKNCIKSFYCTSPMDECSRLKPLQFRLSPLRTTSVFTMRHFPKYTNLFDKLKLEAVGESPVKLQS